jgi:hypothetical protein
MNKLQRTATTLLLAASTLAAPLAFAQQEAPIAPKDVKGIPATAPTWTAEQLITSTVHDAWLLSNRDEATFFEMVRTLAEMSAKNRNITLPDDAATGRRLGEKIKTLAKADTDQLLYVVVDNAIRATIQPSTTANKPSPSTTR